MYFKRGYLQKEFRFSNYQKLLIKLSEVEIEVEIKDEIKKRMERLIAENISFEDNLGDNDDDGQGRE